MSHLNWADDSARPEIDEPDGEEGTGFAERGSEAGWRDREGDGEGVAALSREALFASTESRWHET